MTRNSKAGCLAFAEHSDFSSSFYVLLMYLALMVDTLGINKKTQETLPSTSRFVKVTTQIDQTFERVQVLILLAISVCCENMTSGGLYGACVLI